MAIHTIGDSHSYYGWNSIPEIQVHYMSGKLCYSYGRDGLNIKDGFNINEGDTVIFCFGEIDCRCHVKKYTSDTHTYKQVIDEIIDKYFIEVKKSVSRFDTLKTVIYNVVPAVENGDNPGNAEYPFVGTSEERKSYVLYFNERLQQKCLEYNFIFFNIYDKYTDSNGYLDKSLSDGDVHIGDGTHLKSFIEKNL